MRGYVLRSGPLVVKLCGKHVHEGLERLRSLPSKTVLTPGDPADCSLCSCPPE